MGSERPKRAKMSPKEPSQASKNQKPAFAKTLKNVKFLIVFRLPRPSKTALGGPRRLLSGSYRAPKALKKWNQKWVPF